MMKTVKVSLNTSDRSYNLLIENGIFENISSLLKKNPVAGRYLIISDDNVSQIYGSKLLKSMRSKGIKVDLIDFKAGEKNKNFKTYTELIEKAFSLGYDRYSAIIALGGGVVGDMAGFVAATYMRGIRLVYIPTSLLSQVDSCIGGKVGVDLKEGKNIVGSFFQPDMVFIDPLLLKTLPKEELLCGLAEVIKHSIIKDKKYFNYLDKNMAKILSLDPKVIFDVIYKSCEIKASVVSIDEKESGLRKILNYGHTIAHAVETLTKYKKFNHGYSVALGMAVESKISSEMKLMPRQDIIIQNALLEKAGFDLKLPNLPIKKLITQIRRDKKSISGKLLFVLPKTIGQVASRNRRYTIEVPEKVIENAFRSFV